MNGNEVNLRYIFQVRDLVVEEAPMRERSKVHFNEVWILLTLHLYYSRNSRPKWAIILWEYLLAHFGFTICKESLGNNDSIEHNLLPTGENHHLLHKFPFC